MSTNYNINKTEEEWRKELSPEQYHILREAGTERPHTGKYNMHFEDGEYHCAACNTKLFDSDSKFESGCGWPSEGLFFPLQHYPKDVIGQIADERKEKGQE